MDSFSKTYTFVGDLTDGKEIISIIKAEITFNIVGQEKIIGSFFGDDQLFQSLNKFMFRQQLTFYGIWKSIFNSSEIAFKLKNIRVNKFWPHFETDRLCDFDCEELEMDTEYIKEDEENKVTVLYLSYSIPCRSELIVPKILPELKKEWTDYKEWIEFETSVGLLKVRTHDHSIPYMNNNLHGTFEYSELNFDFEVQINSRKVNDVCEEVDKIVEDYLALISFIIQSNTNYYRRAILYSTSDHRLLREVDKFLDVINDPSRERWLIQRWNDLHPLLLSLAAKYLSHNSKDNIKDALIYFLSAIRMNLIEGRLLFLQASLEVIVNSLKMFYKISAKSCSTCGMEKGKIRDYIIELSSKMDVDLSDIYPTVLNDPEKSFPFIRFRNSVTHGRLNNIDYNLLRDELKRLQLLVERFLMHWIGIDARTVPYLEKSKGLKAF